MTELGKLWIDAAKKLIENPQAIAGYPELKIKDEPFGGFTLGGIDLKLKNEKLVREALKSLKFHL